MHVADYTSSVTLAPSDLALAAMLKKTGNRSIGCPERVPVDRRVLYD